MERYGEDEESKIVDTLLTLYAGCMDLIRSFLENPNVETTMSACYSTLPRSVSTYQAALDMDKTNPFSSFSLLRDSLLYLLVPVNVTCLEEDIFPTTQRDAVLKTLFSNYRNLMKQHGEKSMNEQVTNQIIGLSSHFLDYSTNSTHPFNPDTLDGGYLNAQRHITSPLEKVPSIVEFVSVIRNPLAMGLLSLLKEYWLLNLSDRVGQESADKALSTFKKEYALEIQPNMTKLISDANWPPWAISLLPYE